MRKKLLTSFFLLAGFFSIYAQSFLVLETQNSQLRNISTDGKYAVGIDPDPLKAAFQSYLWDTEMNTFEWFTTIEDDDKNGSLTAVNEQNDIVGYFVDWSTQIHGVRDPLAQAAIWIKGEKIPLGYGNFTPDDFDTEGGFNCGSYATCISVDGKTIGGYIADYKVNSWTRSYIPCIWKYNEDKWEFTELAVPEEATYGAIVSSISGDGTVYVGKIQVNAYTTDGKPVIWNSEGESLLFPELDEYLHPYYPAGICMHVSENGRYAAIRVNNEIVVRYDIEEKNCLQIDLFTGIDELINVCVTNNGELFGTIQYKEWLETGFLEGYYIYPTRSFYYSDEYGLVDFDYYLSKVAPELELPDNISFKYELQGYSYIQSITTQGNKIAGYTKLDSGNYVSWVFDRADNEFILVRPPISVTANTTNLQEVTIEWVAPEVDEEEYKLIGYKIYRDLEFIGETDETTTMYVDKDVPSGRRIYSVTGIYQSLAFQEVVLESPRSENTSLSVADNFNLPFFEDFDTWSWDTNYWTLSGTTEWGILAYFGIQSSYAANISSTKGSVIATSRHMDATQLENIYLAYAKTYTFDSYGGDTSKDSLLIEVSVNNGNWIKVARHSPTEENRDWEHQIIDISDLVAGEIFQVRLHAIGEGDSGIRWFLDWFSVGEQIENPVPFHIKGYMANDKVNLYWKNSLGKYALSYLNSPHFDFAYSQTYWIGNEGESLIMAKEFDPIDLQPYKNSYLTSIHAFLHGDQSTELELVIFENDVEVRRQKITEFTPEAENTFALDEPLLINGSRKLKYGIHVVKNSTEKIFRYQSIEEGAVTGKSDLYSTDNGKTWQTIYEVFKNDENQGAKICVWDLSANISETATNDQGLTRNEELVGYYIFRDGERLNIQPLNPYQTKFTEDKPDEKVCYTIVAYYMDGSLSDFSEEVCTDNMDTFTGISPIEKNTSIAIYPNPANEQFIINGEFIKAELLNVNGQILLETFNNVVSVADYPEGIYFIRIETGEGISTEKLIIKR